MKPRRVVWNTYGIYPYYVANDQRSAAGVHLVQVRRLKGGDWQERILKTDGTAQAPGPAYAISEAEGEARYLTAVQRWEAEA
jgi:hypothetical protein